VTDPTGVGLGTEPWQSYLTEDDTGFRYPRGHDLCGFAGMPYMVLGLPLEAFPRRQPDFLLRLLDRAGVAIATLRVPNPVRGPFPSWEPQVLPHTQTNGPVILKLTGMREIANRELRSVRPEWNLRSSDPAWKHASARVMGLADATGNEGNWLSFTEPAWKVQALVYREREADSSAEEPFILTNLVIPKPGSFAAIDQVAERNGVSLSVKVLAGAGQFWLTNIQRMSGEPNPTRRTDDLENDTFDGLSSRSSEIDDER